jgi:hypothetical protein
MSIDSRRGLLFAITSLILTGAALAQGPNGQGAGRGNLDCVDSATLVADGQWYCFNWSNPSVVEGPVIATPVFVTGPNRVDVTDCQCAGDSFRVVVDGQVVGTTPSVPPEPNCDRFSQDLDACFNDPAFSHASFQLGPGQHSVQIEVAETIFSGGSGAVRAHRVIQAIPTLSQIGLAVFLLALLGASLFILRRRRAV